MTWLAAVDESGNLGSDSRFFVMSAVIVRRVRTLSSAFKAIPTARDESKFYNSTDEEILEVLKELSLIDVAIVSVEVDKYDYASKYCGVSGNALYRIVLTDLLDRVFGQVGSHDVNLFVDRSTFVSLVGGSALHGNGNIETSRSQSQTLREGHIASEQMCTDSGFRCRFVLCRSPAWRWKIQGTD